MTTAPLADVDREQMTQAQIEQSYLDACDEARRAFNAEWDIMQQSPHPPAESQRCVMRASFVHGYLAYWTQHIRER